MNSSKHRNVHLLESIIAGAGALIGLAFIGLVAERAHTMMLIAPFGATAVLLFSASNAPFSRPWNIFNSYLFSTLIGAFVVTYAGGGWLAIGAGLGLLIMLMHWWKIVHPPAGANFLIVTQGHLSWYLIAPLFVGLITLVIIAMSVERIKQKFLQTR